MKFLKNSVLLLSLVAVVSCSSVSQNNLADINTIDNNDDLVLTNSQKPKIATKSKFLCVTLPTGGESEIIKVQNLQTKELTSLPVPGSVQGMTENLENNIIYINAKTGTEKKDVSTDKQAYYSLFKLDLKAKQISRILSFSQLGIRPTDFIVDNNNVFVSGKRGGVGSFYGNDLLKNEWFAVGNNISPGKIEFGFTENTFNIVSYDDEFVTRNTVDVKTKQITGRKTIKHDIPFGNNVFIPSPHGLYAYVIHQLKDSFIPYVFNLKQGTFAKFPEVKTNGGLLYSAIVSNDGKHLLTNVNREIYHYRLDGDQLISLPKITLTVPESRNMAMAADNKTLYITHETGDKLSIITFSAGLDNFTLSQMFIGGISNQVYLF